MDDAVIDAMLEGADGGDGISYPRWELAPARLLKACCVVLNGFGRGGPIPEGTDATAALRTLELIAAHDRIKEQLLARATAFQAQEHYRPPYWELVRMANAARKEAGTQAR